MKEENRPNSNRWIYKRQKLIQVKVKTKDKKKNRCKSKKDINLNREKNKVKMRNKIKLTQRLKKCSMMSLEEELPYFRRCPMTLPSITRLYWQILPYKAICFTSHLYCRHQPPNKLE